MFGGGRIRSSSDSPLEGSGFEPSVPRQEKWSMPSSSDQTRVGRTLILGGGAESSWRAETSNSRSRRKTSVLRPMISARTARIDDNLGKGTDGSNPVPSSGESGANRAAVQAPIVILDIHEFSAAIQSKLDSVALSMR